MSLDKVKLANRKWKREKARKKIRDQKKQVAAQEKLNHKRLTKKYRTGDAMKAVLEDLM